MSYGYSSRLVEANKKADKKNLGVLLGRRCIACDIPVGDVAKILNVSRMTVYNWFTGEHTPQLGYEAAINDLLDKL
jgi:hypothetical protein